MPRVTTKHRSTAAPAITPIGRVNRATRRVNPGRYRRVLGARARKNAGMPMVADIDERELPRQDRVGESEQSDDDGDHRRPHRLGDEQIGHPLDVGGDPAALGHDAGQGREPAVEKDELRHRLGGVGARAHGDAQIRLLEREHVVDPVARHGDRVPAVLQRRHHRAFLVGGDPAEDGGLFHRLLAARLLRATCARRQPGMRREHPPRRRPSRPSRHCRPR